MSVSNFVRATIKNSVSDSATSIDVDTASSPFNNPPAPDDHARLFLVDSLDSPTKWEEIEYTGRTAITGGFTLTGVTRNEDSNTGSAQSFDAGHFVVMQPSATTDGRGAIVESGTNSNGSYVRWENGEQMCFAKVTLTFTASSVLSTTWTFPKAFNAAPTSVVNTISSENLGGFTPSISELGANPSKIASASACDLLQYRISGSTDFVSGDEIPSHAIAWGFWK